MSASGGEALSGIQERISERISGRTRPADAEDAPPDSDMAFQRLVDGTVLLFDRERIRRQSAAGFQKPNQFSKKQWAETFKLAFVDSSMRIEGEAELPGDPWFTYRHPGMEGILVPVDDNVRITMREHVVDKLSKALCQDVNAIVFPELAFPPVDLSDQFPTPADFDPFNPAHQAEVDRRFEESAASILDEASENAGRDIDDAPFVFYGSIHCQRSRYNIGVVSPGHPFEQGYVLATEREHPITNEIKVKPETVSRSGPLVHRKRFPARRVGEATRVPGGLGFRLYPSKIGLIAVMICSDAIDRNQFLYVVRHNSQADAMTSPDRIALVIIPSYTHSELLHTTCKDLSELAQTTVFVGNATGKRELSRLYSTPMPPSRIFQCGKEAKDLSPAGILKTRTTLGVRYYEFQPASPRR